MLCSIGFQNRVLLRLFAFTLLLVGVNIKNLARRAVIGPISELLKALPDFKETDMRACMSPNNIVGPV